MDDLLNLLKSLSHIKDFDRIRIGLASPEKIRSWSYGEIKTPETINYRSFKPERDGLFCARIFGPVKDYECLCGKYKLFKHQGIVCEKCGVEVTKASVRRERLGHIELAAPIAHIWYFKSLPSRIGLLLDLSLRDLERVLYFENYIVIDPGSTSLKQGQLLTEAAYLDALETYGQEFDARMGGEAIYEILHSLDLAAEEEKLREQINSSQSETLKKKLRKRLMLVQAFLQSGNKPEWMVLKVLPVLPPYLRPLVPSDNVGRFVTSDLNELYRRVINRNNRTKRLLDLKAPEVVIRNELRILQESVDALLDNGRQHRVVTGTGNKQPLQSLSDMIKGKQGRFRQNLLGKRVDYSGRTVIVVDTSLKLHQCGLPKEMALELFKPFLLNQLQKRGLAISIHAAKQLVKQKIPEIWKILETVVQDYPVLLNRTPTLYRLGIQAFEPVLVEGKAIHLHPLVCKAFDASFEGDQMSVHIPLSIEAQLEARVLMMSNRNIFSPANGEPLIVPSQEMVLGLYFMTRECTGVRGEGMAFVDINEVQRAYENGEVDLQASIEVRLEKERVKTTVGRAILSQCLPDRLPFDLINRCLTKKTLLKLIDSCYHRFGLSDTINFAEKLMHFGFSYATRSGISLGIEDLVIPEQKPNLIREAKASGEEVQGQYRCCMISNTQRYNQVIDIWAQTNNKLAEAMLNQLKSQDSKRHENALYTMIDAGVRSLTPIRKIAGMRGLMIKPDGAIIEKPITANFREGLDIHQYFLSSHNTRKGMAEMALKTANSGYLTRRLVDVAQDVIIAEQDCGTTDGLTLRALIKDGQVLESLSHRVLGRVVAEDIFIHKRKKPFIKAGTLLDEQWVETLEQKGIEQIKVRSPMTCQSQQGVCAMCYGRDLARGHLMNIGEAIGVIAAQSIGESGTKLTLHTPGDIVKRTGAINYLEVNSNGEVQFHNIKLVLQRMKEGGSSSFNYQFANISHSGEISILDDRKIERHKVPYGAILSVNDGAHVEAGQRIAHWYPDASPIISEVAGYIRFVDIFEGVTVNREVDEDSGLITYQVKDPKPWPFHTKNLQPRLKVISKLNKDRNLEDSKQVVSLPPNTIINVEDGVRVDIGDVIAIVPQDNSRDMSSSGLPRIIDLFEARLPKKPAILALRAGTVSFGKETKIKHRFIITDENGQAEEFYIPKWRQMNVVSGQAVEVGDVIVEGEPIPQDIMRLKGINELAKYLVNEMQEIYINHGININDKHFEVIIRQMLRTVTIVAPGDTPFLCGEIVPENRLLEENQKVAKKKPRSGKPATWKRNFLGITKASLATESFISAASFMDTTRVLLTSAIKGKCDDLRGLKENVVIGRLIPAGTGLAYHKDRR
jgi:DNA-directed RNA polymerase subunit beta'